MTGLRERDFRRDVRLVTSPLRMLPDFVIAGEAKCGTTSLYQYILQHPDVLPCDRKEPKNFIDYPQSLFYCRSHYPTLLQKYMAGVVRGRLPITGEATAEYLSSPNVVDDLATVLPEIKVILVLRNPVDRAYSDYCMFRARNRVQHSFEEIVSRSLEWLGDRTLSDLVQAALQVEDFYLRFVARGIYVWNVERWTKRFPVEQMLIIKSEEFFRDSCKVLHQIFDFLSLDAFTVQQTEVKRKGEFVCGMGKEIRRKLNEFYAPYNRELYKMLGTNMAWGEETDSLEAIGERGLYKGLSN